MRIILVLILCAAFAGSAAAADSPWQTAREALAEAKRAELRSLKAKTAREMRVELRASRKSLKTAADALGSASLADWPDALEVSTARARDGEAIAALKRRDRNAAKQLVRAAIATKTAVLKDLGGDMDFEADVEDSTEPDDKEFFAGYDHDGDGAFDRRLAGTAPTADEIWLSTPATITAISEGAALKRDRSSARLVTCEQLSPHLVRCAFAPALAADEIFALRMQGLPAGTPVLLDVVSRTREVVQPIRVRTP
jgi:hypothetical protein